jgi:hypothetical protein
MKNLFILAFILVSLSSSAQKKVSGFYKGTLFNDSTKMVQQYELALAEYRGKIMGYAYVTFVANDTFYYGIRKINAKIIGDSLIVQDDKIIANNFPESPAKHVNRTVTIPFNGQDSLISINGKWKTNQTKVYYAVPGSVEASKSDDSSGSALFAHLKELNLMPNDNYVATAEPETKTKQKQDKTKAKIENPSSVAETKVKAKEGQNKIKKETKPAAEKTEPPVLSYNQRKERLQQTIEVNSDSLLLSFYDNGVVDGDSISVYLNGQPVVTNTRLTSVATKKTIYVGDLNDVELLLVAENLGSIPPNTGLLIIHDGDKTYQVNFTADMQTNAGIILRRKKN